LIQDGFPNSIRDDVLKVIEMIIASKTYSDVNISVSKEDFRYIQDGIEFRFPDRMYHIDLSQSSYNHLSVQQQMILHCIYSRSCDGFVRHKHIKSLLLMDYPDWAIPYIFKLCDEYVVEILETTYSLLRIEDTERIRKFCLENDQIVCRSYDRMVSYWNEYYKHQYQSFRRYIGGKLFRDFFGYPRSIIHKI
jgi:hypothetical protein